MRSRILSISGHYSRFENILPDQLVHNEIKEELETARNEIKKITDEDLKSIQQIINAFNTNLKHYGDKILEELQKDGIIQIK
jgi:hypothetical protein